MVRSVELNLNLRRPSLYTRISAQVIKALPATYIPIINSAADVVGRIMTSRPVEYGMRILFARSYDLGGARRIASGADLARLTLPQISLSSSMGWSIPQPAIIYPPARRQFDWKAVLAKAEKELSSKNRSLPKNSFPGLPSEVKESAHLSAKWVSGSAQVEMGRFSDGARKMIERLISATTGPSEQRMKEHLSMAIELADGTFIPIVETTCSGEGFGCSLPKDYKTLEKEALTKAAYYAINKGSLKTGTVKIYHFHTHPEIEGMDIEKDAEGRVFTELSRNDYAQSEMWIFDMLIHRLRIILSGPIEVVMGAIPALADGQTDRLNIATYTQQIPCDGIFKKQAA